MNHKRRAEKLSLVRGEHTLIVGVDIAKRKHWAVFMDGVAELPVGRPLPFHNTRDGLERLLDEIRTATERSGAARVVVGMEPSGHYWKALASFLVSQGLIVVCVSPLHVKRAKEFDDNSPTKNDQKDAWVIARRVNDGDFFAPHLPHGVYAELRILTQARYEVRVKFNQALNQLHAILDEYFPEFTTVFANPLGLAAEHALHHFPFPSDVLAQPIDEIAKALKKASGGKVGMKRAVQLHRAASRTIGVGYDHEAARLRLRQKLDEISFYKRQLDTIEASMAAALDRTGIGQYLLSVPGVGIVTAASFLGETGDLTRFENWRQVQKLAGFNLKESSSGQHRGRTTITKRGRPGLRSTLYLAAVILVSRNAQFKALYQYFRTREANPLKGKQALIAVACKLIRVLFTLGQKQRYYDVGLVLGEFRSTQLGCAA